MNETPTFWPTRITARWDRRHPFCVQLPRLHDGRINNSNWFCCLRFVKVAAAATVAVIHIVLFCMSCTRAPLLLIIIGHVLRLPTSICVHFFSSYFFFPISQWTAIILYAEVPDAAAAVVVVVVVIAVVAYLISNPFRTWCQRIRAAHELIVRVFIF